MNKISIIAILSTITLMITTPISGSGQQMQAIKIGEIEFFGIGDPGMRTADVGLVNKRKGKLNFTGEQLEQLRRALPIKEGEEFKFESGDSTLAAIKRAVKETIGREATDVNFVCCNDRRDAMIFIGLPGAAYRPVQYNPAPTHSQNNQLRGRARLPLEIVRLVERAGELASDAAQNEPREDRSKGYALSLYAPMREIQIRIREYALDNGPLLRRVVRTSSHAKQRRAAAYALGYADPGDAQLVALARAARDSDSAVRNDATRALGVLAQSNPKVAARIPAAGFVDLLSSGSWSDRNKSGLLLSVLTARRDPALLSLLRRQALEALIEMARWRNRGHAENARIILGRVAGIEETLLQKLAREGKVEEIIEAASRKTGQ